MLYLLEKFAVCRFNLQKGDLWKQSSILLVLLGLCFFFTFFCFCWCHSQVQVFKNSSTGSQASGPVSGCLTDFILGTQSIVCRGFPFVLICLNLYYIHPPLAQLVRAQSLYLWGTKFESWRADKS